MLIQNHYFKAFIFITSATLAAGCIDDDIPSLDIPSDQLRADINVTASEFEPVVVTVHLKSNSVQVELGAGEELYAYHRGIEQWMEHTTSVELNSSGAGGFPLPVNANIYRASYSDIINDEIISILFDRNTFDDLNTSIQAPNFPHIQTPVNNSVFSESEEISMTWLAPEDNDTAVSVDLYIDCSSGMINDDEHSSDYQTRKSISIGPDDSEASINIASYMPAKTGTANNCDAELTLNRYRQETPEGFSSGSTIRVTMFERQEHTITIGSI